MALHAAAPGKQKYVICNADEGDPGAFMDRSVLESDPHSVLEGMIIAGYAIGADARLHLRARRVPEGHRAAEHRDRPGRGARPARRRRPRHRIRFHIKLKEGAGAFVCGEETALIASIEGKRGMPRVRPPFPAVKGLWESPTNINNVETFANVPWIVMNGAKAFNRLGTDNSKGTKVFAMAGKIRHGGLVEVPMGISIREIVYDICGGIRDDRKFKAVQMGGPSGGCIPAELQDTVDRLRVDQQDGRHHGLGRPGRDGRDHLHGGRRPVLPGVHPARVVRQVHVLPRRHEADARGARASPRARARTATSRCSRTWPRS